MHAMRERKSEPGDLIAARGELYGLLQLSARGINPDQTLEQVLINPAHILPR